MNVYATVRIQSIYIYVHGALFCVSFFSSALFIDIHVILYTDTSPTIIFEYIFPNWNNYAKHMNKIDRRVTNVITCVPEGRAEAALRFCWADI